MSRLTKIFSYAFGLLFLFLGIVGIFVPLLPTTPFVLLSVFFFSKSSKRFHDFLLEHSMTGPLVRNWKKSGSIPFYGKVAAFLTISSSSFWVWEKMRFSFLSLSIFSIFTGLLLFILTRPTTKS